MNRVICDTCGYIYARGPGRQPGDADLVCSKKRGTLRDLTADEVAVTGGLCGYLAAFGPSAAQGRLM